MSDKLGLVWLATDRIWDSVSEDMKSGVEAYSRSVGVDGFFQVTDESLMFTDMGQTVTLKEFDPRYIDEAPKLAQRIHELLSAASLRARPQEPGLSKRTREELDATAPDEIANLKAELASVKAHDASSVSNWQFALKERDEARAELQRLRDAILSAPPFAPTPEETFIEGLTGDVVLYGMTTQDAIERLRKENRPMDVYHRFIEEVDVLTIKADWGAVKVVGELTRAVKRAQLVHDGELKPVSER